MWERITEEARRACASRGPGHDFSHVLRVTENAMRLARRESVDEEVLRAAALLHELFNHPKDHPESHRSGEICAERAATVLASVGFPEEKIEAVAACIRDHAFSRGVIPESLEGKVLQDADRLDAIGAIGVARWAATCSEMGTPFYHPEDPFCRGRYPDDKRWGLDHFYRKLFAIPDTLHTRSAKRLAERRVAFLRRFVEELGDEIGD